MVKPIAVTAALLISSMVWSQSNPRPFIKLVQPVRESTVVKNARQFISGSTCKGCELTVNGSPVKVYSSGGFAYELNLKPGDNQFNLLARSGTNTIARLVTFRYAPAAPPDTVKTLGIAAIEINPAGNLLVRAGDRLRFRVKALPGARVYAIDSLPLYELPTGPGQTMPGIYQGEYTIRATDSFSSLRIPFFIKDSAGNTVTRRADQTISILNIQKQGMVITRGRLAHLLYGIGEDRLGGAKIGYIDSSIVLQVTGKVNDLYRVQLTPYRTAYIPDDVVEPLPPAYLSPKSLTGNWRVYGDSVSDYVTVALDARLPYQSMQQADPARIVVDVFGATINTNWITQLENTREIKNVSYEQLEDEVVRITIDLRHQQHWGHRIFYTGNRLNIQVRRQPEQLDLRHLRIAIDAGHGGSNTGAGGPTGSSEKELALAVSLKLKKALQYYGTHVMMTRQTEQFVDNKERILMYRDSMPDLLISIHLNSSADPVNVGGTGTFYRYTGFRPFSHAIYKRMLELGLKEYGNTGSFNFMLNSPIEYPNALVEMLFISNPEEEALILDEKFQQDIADKIVQGIKDFLQSCQREGER